MKTNFKLLITLVALNIAASITIADQSNISISSWEQHPEKLALLITLEKNSVIIHIRNTSDNLVKLANQGSSGFVKLYYIDSRGEAIRLGDHRLYNDKRDEEEGGPSGDDILPGAELTMAIALAPDDLALIKAHLIKCSFIIYDPTNKRQFAIESSPRLLTETAVPAPGK